MPKPADAAEWITVALDDLDNGDILFRGNKFNVACFFAQQAAEKALKGFIVANDISHPKIHDLIELDDFCTKINSDFSSLRAK